MSVSLFSTYRTGENRVTASILAVLRSLTLERIERLLGALTEDSDFRLVTFKNQRASSAGSVPDAAIESSCRVLVETKIKRNAIRVTQLQGHLKRLDGSTRAECLLVLTPDDARPSVLDKIADERLSWSSFAALDQAIDELLSDRTEVISEREAFLLRELQRMLLEEGLLGFEKDTVIIAAGHAWPEYQRAHAYVCKAERTFQPVQYMGFYTGGQILPVVARVLDVQDRVAFETGLHSGRVGEIVDLFLSEIGLHAPLPFEGKVFVLSAPDAPETIHLDAAVENDLKSAKGTPVAFVQGQRYVRLEDLKKATLTSELA